MSNVKKARYKAVMQESVELGRALQRLLWSKTIDHGSFGFEFAVSYVLFLRAERSLASIRSLVSLDLSDDAMALIRVMVEKIITAEYILLVGMEPALDFVRFQAFSTWRNYDETLKARPDLAPRYTEAVVRELEAAHNVVQFRTLPDGTVRKRFGRGHDWTDLSLSKRAEIVDELLKARRPRATAAAVTMFYASYKKSAAYLHSSFESIVRSMEKGETEPSTDPELSELRIGIRTRDKGHRLGIETLHIANAAAFQMLAFMAEVLNDEKTRKWAYKFAAKKLPDHPRSLKHL